MAYARPRPGQSNMKRLCAACHEPAQHCEKLGEAWICQPCMARLKARAAHKRADARQRNADRRDLRDVMKNRPGDKREDGGLVG